jgi:hypothetical protein
MMQPSQPRKQGGRLPGRGDKREAGREGASSAWGEQIKSRVEVRECPHHTNDCHTLSRTPLCAPSPGQVMSVLPRVHRQAAADSPCDPRETTWPLWASVHPPLM